MNTFLLNSTTHKKSLLPLFSVIYRSSILPSLECVFIHKSDNRLSFTTSDLENNLCVTIEPDIIKGDISFLLHGRALKQIICNQMSELIDFKITADKASISAGDLHLKMALTNPDNFPKPILISEYKECVIGVHEIHDLFYKALRFVSHDDLRPAMTGVCIVDKEGELFIVATDGHMMYYKSSMKTPESLKGVMCIIPPKGISLFLQAFHKGEITIRVSSSHIEFEQPGTRLTCRLIEARYPDWQQVIPSNDTEFYMQRKTTAAFLKIAHTFVNQSTRQISLIVTNDNITISGGDDGFGDELLFKMPIYNCNKTFNPFKFAINSSFLNKIVSLSKDEYCKFTHSGWPTKAMIVDDCYLLMPMMLHE